MPLIQKKNVKLHLNNNKKVAFHQRDQALEKELSN